jgi:hypothetical protein
MPTYDNLDEMQLENIFPAHICDIIKSFASKGSTDINGISSKLLKMVKIEISKPLAHIFTLSVTQGIFPDKLKTSRTVPIFKSGDPLLCDNYRPISLLNTFSKILEKILSVKLVNHLDHNKIIHDHQYGFQKHKSTQHSLIHAFNFIGNALNENKFCIGIFFDLKKAFDVCSLDILLKKLKKIGINGTVYEWFKSYLSNRKQFTDINGNFSSERLILTCILQGSILGPILFLIYINDLHLVSPALTLMFADDTLGLKSNSDLTTLINEINVDIKRMALRFKANKLAVNKGKTKYIIFKTKNKKLPQNLPDVLYDENEHEQPYSLDKVTILERIHKNHNDKNKRAYKLLGVYMDENLSLDYHIEYLIKKLNKSMFCIRSAKNFLNKTGLRSLYFALIHSHLSYCPIILGCTTNSNLNKLFKVQKKPLES